MKNENLEEEESTKRLKILQENEIKLIYDLPKFSDEEKEHYFELTEKELNILSLFRVFDVKINFILQNAYFKAKNRFFSFSISEVSEDIFFIINKYFSKQNIDISLIKEINKNTWYENQKKILSIYKYNYFNESSKQVLQEKLAELVKISAKPIYLFRQIYNYFNENKIILPSYTSMQDYISSALKDEELRLIKIIETHSNDKLLYEIESLIKLKNLTYEISNLKKLPKDFKYKEIKKEIERQKKIKRLYNEIQFITSLFDISSESIKYYSSLINYYDVNRLNSINIKIVRIYIICFLYNRFHICNDNLINAFIHHVRSFDDDSKEYAKEKILNFKIEANKYISKASKILRIFTDKTISEEELFSRTKRRAFRILEEDKIELVADYIENKASFDEMQFRFEYIENNSSKFKINLRKILMNIDFYSSKKSNLLNSIIKLKNSLLNGKSLKDEIYEFDLKFISKCSIKYFYNEENKIIPDRYEFFVYKNLKNFIEAGDIYCNESILFKSFESEIISDDEWKNKDKIIESLNLGVLQKPINIHLKELEKELESKIAQVNHEIQEGKNIGFELNKKLKGLKWHLNTPPIANEMVNHKIFDSLKQVDICDVLTFADIHTDFILSFDHILAHYTKSKTEREVIKACILAWATNMGLSKMGEISDINYKKLIRTSDNLFRLETLQNANDKIINQLFKLDIFSQYHINDLIHSTTDGQKYETKISTMNSTYSPKYFGLKKGIVSYTMVANNIPINAKIIGANQHESHYVFDLLHNNTSNIKPKIHSTDTHGTNNLNFAILKVFNYQFAPRYKDFYDTFTKSLLGFKDHFEYKDLLLKPKRKINTKLIIEEWDAIQKIFISLGIKKTTQCIIIRKLSSYARKSKTKKALFEYNNIIKSLYLLDYVSSVSLRQNVQKALNRGESYHQLKRTVAFANFGKLKFSTEEDQQIWDSCARLVTNAIIFYNELIFQNLIDNKILSKDSIKLISPIAWQHINLFGKYEFTKDSKLINIAEITNSEKLKNIKY